MKKASTHIVLKVPSHSFWEPGASHSLGKLTLPCSAPLDQSALLSLYPSTLFTPLLLPSIFVLASYHTLRTILKKEKNTPTFPLHRCPTTWHQFSCLWISFYLAFFPVTLHLQLPGFLPLSLFMCPDTCLCFFFQRAYSFFKTFPEGCPTLLRTEGEMALIHSSSIPFAAELLKAE